MKITRRLIKKIAIGSVVMLVLSLAAIEIIGRAVGVCDPPLLVEDAEMEYRFDANQNCTFLGKHIVINEFSQRSGPVGPRIAGQMRVLVLGDSVVYGGNQLDQSEIATSRLQAMLSRATDRHAEVLNASAGSWGPPNLLAYVNKFGDFGSDIAVIVLSTQDADDKMTFTPTVGVNSSFPDKKPASAISILVGRYVPRFFAIRAAQETPVISEIPEADPAIMESITRLIQRLGQAGRPVIVVMHPQREELNAPAGNLAADNSAWTAIRTTTESAGATFIDARPTYRQASKAGFNLYRDTIHPSAEGQRVLAEVMRDAVLKVVTPTTRP